jgi:hypothetical protein
VEVAGERDRGIPRVFRVAAVMYSSPWNMKKHCRFPMSSEDMDMAQNIAEFLVMVSGFELLARKVP